MSTGAGDRARRAGRAAWIAAAAFALLWHAALLFGLRPFHGPAYAAPSHHPPRVRFQPARDTLAGSLGAVRDVWSPILFSLPTPLGFSRAGNASERLRPPLDPPSPPTWFLEAPPAVQPGLAVVPPDTLAGNAAARLRAIDAPTGDARSALRLPPASAARLEVRAVPGWQPAASPPLELADLPAADTAWSATVHVAFNARGEAEHVLVESGSPPGPVAIALDRALRAWRLPPGEPAPSGRLFVRYQPPAVPPNPAEPAP